MEIYRTIVVAKDHHIADVAAYALEQANASLVPVVFWFHGVIVVTLPHDSLDALLSAWIDDYDSAALLTGSAGA